MPHNWIIQLGIPLALVCACAAAPPRTLDAGGPVGALPGIAESLKMQPAESIPPDPVASEDTPLFRQAAALDRLMKGLASNEEAQALKKECSTRRHKNPFCPIVRDAKRLKVFWEENERPYKFREAPPKTPITPLIEGGKVANYPALRRADVESLLAGFKPLPPEHIVAVKEKALAATGCPDNAAVAIAATLEDGMPSLVNPKEVAALYARVGMCFPKRSSNREHFLTRSGLLSYFVGDFASAEKVLSKVDPTDALQGRPLFWLYRSRKALGDTAKADKALKRLIGHHPLSFHALVATLEMGQAPENVFLRPATPPKKRSKRVTWANAWLEALETLKRYGFLSTTERLTFWVSAKATRLEPEVRLYLAQFGSPLFKVTRLTELFIRRRALMSVDSFKMAYPLAYWPLMERDGMDLDPLLLLAVGRKESKFDPYAVSPANAQGLLQIHPDTAKRLTGGAEVDLTNPYVNITLGAHYLTELLRRLDGKMYWALAAYNAGELATNSWIGRFPHSDPMLQIDLITFRETRNYVGFVLSNYFWYRRLYQPDKGNPLDNLVRLDIARK